MGLLLAAEAPGLCGNGALRDAPIHSFEPSSTRITLLRRISIQWAEPNQLASVPVGTVILEAGAFNTRN